MTDKRIDQLPDAPTVEDTDFMHTNKAGVDYRALVSTVKNFTDQGAAQVTSTTIGNNLTGTNVQSNIDELAGRGNVSEIRYSKLDDPLLHILKKNKLTQTITGTLSWTRSGGGGSSYIDRYGIVRYSPTDNTTNLALHSEDFTDAVWTKSSSTVTANTAISPDGTLTANGLDADSTATIIPSMYQDITVTSSITYTVSMHVKKKEASFIQIAFSGGQVDDDPRANFDLNSGVLGSVDPNINATINEVSDGYFRCTATVIAATSTLRSFFTLIKSSNDTRTQANAWTLGDGVFIWGAQVEESRVANGYLKTTTTSVTGTSLFGITQAREEADGWLIEGDSDNLALHSEEFDNVIWTKGAIGGATAPIVTANVDISPDGTLTADRVQFAIGSDVSGDLSLLRQDITAASAGTLSVWLKSNTGSNQEIGFRNPNSLTHITVTNEWERFEAPFVIDAGSSLFGLNLRGTLGTGALTSDILVWGFQLEELPFASSYIPTEGSTSSRSSDLVNFQVSNNIPLLTSSWSLYFSIENPDFDLAVFDHSSTSFSLFVNTAGDLRLFTPLAQLVVLATGLDVTKKIDIGITYDGTSLIAYIDGVGKTPVIRSFTDITTGNFRLATTTANTLPMYGHLQDFRSYDFALNSEEMAFLSD